jgi:urease accessory protein
MSSARWAAILRLLEGVPVKKLPFVVALIVLVTAGEPAFAHHVMGGRMAATFGEGLLSGLGHPVIGIDHFAAVVAIGCIAAARSNGIPLVIGYIVAMMCGVGLHLLGATVPAAELLVALTVLGLGVIVAWRREMPVGVALTLFALVGLIHGYALGESIYGAERTPLLAYLLGLAVIQSAVALAAMTIAKAVMRRSDLVTVRLIGAGVAGVGIAVLVQQIIPAPPG